MKIIPRRAFQVLSLLTLLGSFLVWSYELATDSGIYGKLHQQWQWPMISAALDTLLFYVVLALIVVIFLRMISDAPSVGEVFSREKVVGAYRATLDRHASHAARITPRTPMQIISWVAVTAVVLAPILAGWAKIGDGSWRRLLGLWLPIACGVGAICFAFYDRDQRSRALGAICGVLLAAGAFLFTSFYLQFFKDILLLQLIFAFSLGAAPGFALYVWLLKRIYPI